MTNGPSGTRRVLAALFASVFLVFAAAQAQAQGLRLHVSEDSVTVGQRFYVSISAEHTFTADPQFPEPTDTLRFGDLEVLRRHALNSFSRGETRIDSVVYEVTTFALDTAFVGPISVLFTAGEDTFSVHTEEAFVPVISLVPPDAADVKDLAPLVEFPRPIWLYVVGAAALLLLAALLAFYMIRRRNRRTQPAEPPPPAVPPHVEALKRLRALENADLQEKEAAQPFYTELSDTLRHYLARRLDVNAMETTTRELIRELSSLDTPGASTRRSIQSVLSLADYVKFADANPTPEKGREALDDARSIITSVEDELSPPEPAPTEETA